jgi:hypothetical protein
MKRFLLIAVLVAALAALLAGTALAAGPVTPTAQGFGPGMGIHTPGTGMMTPGTGMGSGGRMGRGAPAWAGQPDEVATLLHMSAEQIQARRLAGESLVQIAESKDPAVSEDTLINTIIEAKTTDLAALVTAGKLTQDQMKLMVEHMQTQVKTMVERSTAGPMQGRGQGMGQMQSDMGGGRAGMGQGFRGGRGTNQ